MKHIYNLAFKMAISATVALIFANSLNLKFGPVAAVIAILSIQDTRKKALIVGRNRAFACLIGQGISFVLYIFIGQNPIVFGLFLIIFIPLTSKLKIEEGMIAAVVLSTHLLVAENINFYWIVNEILIMLIGIGTSAIANLFMPSLEHKFKKNKDYIEESFRVILFKMSKSLLTHTVDIDEAKLMNELERNLDESKNTAYKIVNNNFFKTNSYHTDYINMRLNQFDTIKRMRLHFDKFSMSFKQTTIMANFIKEVAKNIKEANDCRELLRKLNILRAEFKKMELPKTREEFENRSQLLQLLNDMEEFLEIKRNFVKSSLKHEI
ncbi:aromatic acid exporter family protein [Clostridium chauvoei]|uniref:aromatic acid exporter family protein n=1 Tax=Clostridium chauvoei TaxID=46867 RepID=UPI000BB8C1D9|nr:aromatic acid exporter family protein [Clostridium chauvoei]ATD56962.1 hypothetical protein BTM21_04060 [Clostridium chauvoei]MBX7378943.1 aromatic acid exporter family protein [Clostridium chauvoei]MBX7383955.1 aromatic acid exporter family protein [Clostridium chauvoei]MBX7396587.1 aromatic acid exporter family protein [Clostridium chauvoei]MBX7399100.1 aromatic acid exporter family protein [Clostridium chauvoei]